jgi:hypothetical protein
VKKLFFITALLVVASSPALAQAVTSAVPATTWSTLVAGIMSALEPVALAALTALGGYVLTRVSTWLTGKISDQARDRVISGAENAGKVALASLIASAADGKITLADIITAARVGGAQLLTTYADSAAKLGMTQAGAESVVKGAIMTAAAAQGLTVDLDQPGVVATTPAATVITPLTVTIPEGGVS